MVMTSIGWIIRRMRDHWHAKQRNMDLLLLWPECCRLADGDLDRAKAAFAVHAFNDVAWTWLGHDAVYEYIENMRPVFTCPVCHKQSHNPDDYRHSYCGNCHRFTKDLS